MSGVDRDEADNGCVRVRGAREHNLKNVSLDIPRDAFVVFTGVSGSGKSSLAFGTIYAEAQRRYFESVAPYARRLIEQAGVPAVNRIDGLPPAVALQQTRGGTSTRSTVGSLSTLSNALRMLYSRAGDYPAGQALLESDAFSPNTPAGACPDCHGLGRVFDATEDSMVPDPSLTIRERAVACWPQGWQGKNYRDILTTLGYDVDRPWRELPQDQREAITQLESLMVTRVETLTQQAISCQPRWLRSLGTPPTDPRRRADWTRAVAVIAAYRDRYAVPEHAHPLGDPDIRDPDRRLAYRQALAAGRQARAATESRPGPVRAAASAARNAPSL